MKKKKKGGGVADSGLEGPREEGGRYSLSARVGVSFFAAGVDGASEIKHLETGFF